MLDHAIYFHVSSRLNLTPREAQAVSFPVCETQHQWSSWRGQPPAQQWITAEFRDAIESVQPFAAKNIRNPRHATIHALSELANIDKHRAFHVVNYSGQVTFDPISEPLTHSFMGAAKGVVLTDGAVVATKRLLRPLNGSHSNRWDYEALAGYTEAIDLPGVGALPLLGLCDLMVKVAAEVLDKLEQAH
ncbi:hypothetical protein [Gordonia rhizosphera]|uniref:Uncharacterized protein n=1 Tax=Gordonia rhizosphera NBRC 16068 TaxID=1108045 RepID=K6WCJ6_9ACTN|nr:hypothetical protein [Gordonia rhizosphera]GAB91456.1 hypothetical protein GORHZ_135_00050 [Gordonia rhizosphera NBRC 16068]